MRTLIVTTLLLLTSAARAENWRVKISAPSRGELVAWPTNRCGRDVADHVRRVVQKHPYIEVVDGQMAAQLDEKNPVPAQRQALADSAYVAFYDVTETRTIAFSILWKKARKNQVPVKVSVIAWDKPGDREDPSRRIKGCHETWLGVGERI
jgi:hypothetical protein